jgi:hypothetical protein
VKAKQTNNTLLPYPRLHYTSVKDFGMISGPT